MNERINVMLDPSLFADNSYKSTFEMVSEQNDEMNFSISKRFRELLLENQLTKEESVRDYFSSYSSFYESESIKSMVTETEVTVFSAEEYYQEYSQYYDAISEAVPGNEYYSEYGSGNYLPDILFDEFVFSIENSPILSRLKKVAETFKNAVSYTVEVSEPRLEENWNSLQQSIGNEIASYRQIIEELEENADDRLDDDDPIILSTYLRQAVKDYAPNWVIHISERYISALMGVAVGGMVGGPVGGAAGAAAGAITQPAFQDLVMYLADP